MTRLYAFAARARPAALDRPADRGVLATVRGLLPGPGARRSPSGSASRRPFPGDRSGPPGSFGHFGTGGAVGFADPAAGVAFGYAMNHVIPRWQSSRNRALIDALYGCCDGLATAAITKVSPTNCPKNRPRSKIAPAPMRRHEPPKMRGNEQCSRCRRRHRFGSVRVVRREGEDKGESETRLGASMGLVRRPVCGHVGTPQRRGTVGDGGDLPCEPPAIRQSSSCFSWESRPSFLLLAHRAVRRAVTGELPEFA